MSLDLGGLEEAILTRVEGEHESGEVMIMALNRVGPRSQTSAQARDQ